MSRGLGLSIRDRVPIRDTPERLHAMPRNVPNTQVDTLQQDPATSAPGSALGSSHA